MSGEIFILSLCRGTGAQFHKHHSKLQMIKNKNCATLVKILHFLLLQILKT